MSILVTPQTKVLVQGITGSFGARHTQLSLAYGTRIVAGVTPGKGGQLFEKQVPIFDTVAAAATVSKMGTCFSKSRSEEHTSELQSRLHLVCRLLLEKKKRREPH